MVDQLSGYGNRQTSGTGSGSGTDQYAKASSVASHKVTDRIGTSQERQQMTLERLIGRLETLRPVPPMEAKGPTQDTGSGVFGVMLATSQNIEDKLDYLERLVNEL